MCVLGNYLHRKETHCGEDYYINLEKQNAKISNCKKIYLFVLFFGISKRRKSTCILRRSLKFDEISKLYLKLLRSVKEVWRFSHIFLAFSGAQKSPNEPKIIKKIKSHQFFLAQITEKNKNAH